jgi:hypothetical protein
MILSSGKPPHWAGFVTGGERYDAGALVVHRGQAYVSKLDDNLYGTPGTWAPLGPYGASPTTVTHKWHPQEAKYPAGDAGEMSEAADVCADCWKDADFRNAFRPEVHLYVIRELGL